ncbi:hypothetical protein HETIRDRAFT_119027 [Heterobasidion irregulare TC 32-1]|uniref:Uncharacterized protein n=1 Tax=Heterobasidion irregulare (strain TC 32-1) TaxID=747525 RepID=W4JTQ2_HETIT|nr:uncharacterized protein HETIRDRAFT_119027 [Heterobasidion irregulare TC 32-1]ETW76918.1 hypothetical protein HETIRDRAFT_119027 [Heterobasidion irregulare TC 32-1]
MHFGCGICFPNIPQGGSGATLGCSISGTLQYTKSTTKSTSKIDHLVHSLRDSMRDGFSIKDFTKFNTAWENKHINSYITDSLSPFNEGKGWHQSSIKIHLPANKVKTPKDQAPEFEVKGI